MEKSEGTGWTGREWPEDVRIWLREGQKGQNVTFYVSLDFKLHRGSKL